MGLTLLYVLLFSLSVCVYTQTDIPKSTSTDAISQSEKIAAKCSINSSDPDFRHHVQELIMGGSRLLYMQLNIKNSPKTRIKGKNDTILYNPLSWARTTGRYGTGILMLKQKLQIISMTTLSIGVEEVSANITESPDGCLSELAAEDYEALIRDFLLHDFMGPHLKNTRKKLGEKELICNTRLRRQEDDVAGIYYECCHVTEEEDIKCKEMVIENLMNILLTCVLLFNVMAVMYAPMIIPRSYFKEKFRTYEYEHVLKEPVTITVKREKIRDRDNETNNTVSLSKMCPEVMPHFARTLKRMKDDMIYKLYLSKLEFQVKAEQLVSKSEAPVGILTSVYEALILCELRHKASVIDCCKSSIFGSKKCSCTHRRYTWYKCLRALMHLLFAALLCLPWVARVVIYYYVEHQDVMNRRYFVSSHGMIEPFTGKFVSYLTPIHIVFIICYIILVLDGIILGILSKHVARMVRMVIRKCFRDMHHSSRAHVFGWFIRLLIKPLTHLGIFGLFLLPLHLMFVLPFALCVLSVYFLPTLNIVLRLLVHFLAYSISYNRNNCVRKVKEILHLHKLYSYYDLDYLLRKEKLERPDSIKMRFRFIQLSVILICLVTVLSFVLLAMECIVFFAEYVIYTVIGIILNASFALKYVSVLFMIAIYARECFGSVTNKYCCFNADIHDFVLGKVKKEMKVVAAQDEEEQKNTAFTLPQTPKANQDNNQVVAPSTPVLRVSDGVPKWRTHHLVIFLDREDTSYLTQKFFFDTVNMPHSGGPGNLLSNILSAFAQFMVIILFLLFVILIVMIFGDEYKVSGFNQMIATLVTGFLPWVFRNILFKPHADLSVDTDNVNFQNSFEAVVRNHKQSWELSDLSVDKMEPIMSSSKEVDSSIIASHDDVDEKSKMVDKETKSEDFSETSEMNSMGSIKDTKIDLIINTARNLNKAFQNDEKV